MYKNTIQSNVSYFNNISIRSLSSNSLKNSPVFTNVKKSISSTIPSPSTRLNATKPIFTKRTASKPVITSKPSSSTRPTITASKVSSSNNIRSGSTITNTKPLSIKPTSIVRSAIKSSSSNDELLSERASQSSSERATRPLSEPIVQPSSKPIVQPISQPMAKPSSANQSSSTASFPEGSLPGEIFNDNWNTSFNGLGAQPFSKEISDALWIKLDPSEIEIKPDGLLYLPEIKYRRILNRAFGPGGWGLAPWSQTWINSKMVSREYGLVCHGRLIGISRGEQDYFDPNGVPTAMEGCKSNALMRCCKDLGIASELWDPNFIIEFKKKYCESKYFEKKRRYLWKRKDREWK